MTNEQGRPRYGRPDGVLAMTGKELPDDLPFIAHPTYAGAGFDWAPVLLLAPQFTAFTDEEDSYNPVPYMLAGEGFHYLDLGARTPIELNTRPAEEHGWAVCWDGSEVEIGRPGKRMCRSILDPSPPGPWKRITGRSGLVLVMVLEEQVTLSSTREVARTAESASGAVALLPINRGIG